jgi:hypothetical protein
MIKILFTRNANNEDYLSDCVLNGLYQLPDLEITDSPRQWYMYRNEFKPYGNHNLTERYGNGFTVFGHLEENMSIDRNNIEQKIIDHYFDLVICSRSDQPSPYLNLILQYYNKNEIITMSGTDEPHINSTLLGNSTYFIRELIGTPINGVYPGNPHHARPWPSFNSKDVIPVSFGFPKVKIQTPLPKSRVWSNVQPAHGYGSVYMYTVEQEYYNDYRQSLFGRTKKKGGWDCMRHYEIMACRCIPYFEDLADAPRDVLRTLPRELLLYAKQRVDEKGAEYFMPGQEGWNEYQELEQKIFDHFLENCTTDKLASYVLNTHIKLAMAHGVQ